jgi:hypothetical protein
MNLLTAKEAWQMLLETPRHYQGETTLVGYNGGEAIACPLPKNVPDLTETKVTASV